MRSSYCCAFLVVLLVGCSNQDTAPHTQALKSTATSTKLKKSHALHDRELKLLDIIAEIEKKALLQGAKTLFMSSIASYTSAEIAQTYEENQAAGDAKFLNKSFIVRGTVTGILKGFGSGPFLTLNCGNPSREPQVHVAKYAQPEIAALKKGQSAAFACNGAGSAGGIAMFSDCMMLADYCAEVTDNFKQEIRKFLHGEPVERKDVTRSAVLVLALARTLPEDSTCFSTGETCERELTEKSTREKLQKEAPAVMDELARIGLSVK